MRDFLKPHGVKHSHIIVEWLIVCEEKVNNKILQIFIIKELNG